MVRILPLAVASCISVVLGLRQWSQEYHPHTQIQWMGVSPFAASPTCPGRSMWSVQAVFEPSVNVLSMQHGQVVITCQESKAVPSDSPAQVIGHAKTVELCRHADTTCTDPWLTSDPWSKAISMVPPAACAPAAPPALQGLSSDSNRASWPVCLELTRWMSMIKTSVCSCLNPRCNSSLLLKPHCRGRRATTMCSRQLRFKRFSNKRSCNLMCRLSRCRPCWVIKCLGLSRIEAILSKKPPTEWKQGGPALAPAARMTPGYFRPIRALLSFVLILTMCRIGEGRVSGPDCDTWKLGVCNPFGLQGKHHVLTSVSANVVAISETRMTKLAKRNLSVGFRSVPSKFKHVLSGAPMSPRSNATWIFLDFLPSMSKCSIALVCLLRLGCLAPSTEQVHGPKIWQKSGGLRSTSAVGLTSAFDTLLNHEAKETLALFLKAWWKAENLPSVLQS